MVTHTGDKIVVVLGSEAPLILRPQENGNYRLVGEGIVYGIHHGIGLLGPLPEPWVAKVDTRDLRSFCEFFNTETGDYTKEDPRLPSLKDGDWERVEDHETAAGDPLVYDYFRNKVTGEVMNSDPRLLPDALEKFWEEKRMDKKLEWFRLE